MNLALEELALPLGQRFSGGLLALALAHVGAGDEALGDGVGDHAGEQRDGADGVIVAGDAVVDLVRISVGVQDGDDRDAQLASLGDREVLLLGIDDPHGRGNLGHVANAAERAGQLVLLAAHHEQFLLGVTGRGHVVEVNLLEFLQALQTLGNGGEVGEHTTEPAVVHVGHANALCLLGNSFLCLLLGADEQDVATVCDGRLNSLVCLVDEGEGLLQVDDVDAVALGQDETLHLGVPTAGLVTEVNAGVQHFTHSYDGHVVSFLVPRGPPIRASPTRA